MEEPRTAVGQRADGTVVLLNLQGRQAAALGVSERELAEIMAGYGCVNAGNLDGGASSDIFFRGEYLNVCNTSGGPRPIPTAILVMPAKQEG
jgi:exopolysaccharide biosynthesis protein